MHYLNELGLGDICEDEDFFMYMMQDTCENGDVFLWVTMLLYLAPVV